MPDAGWVVVAYGLAALVIGAYLVRLRRARREVDRRADELGRSHGRGS